MEEIVAIEKKSFFNVMRTRNLFYRI